jgi:porphobilinogen synthase
MKIRPRINRWTPARRNLIFESSINNSLVQPHFVVEGEGINDEITTMPGIFQQSVDVLLETISKDVESGINNHMLFPVIDSSIKDPLASVASSDDMPLQTAVRALREKFGDSIVILTDVCLCTATDHGQSIMTKLSQF